MRQKSNTPWLVRHILLVLLLCLVAEVYPQQNYIRTFVPRVEVSPSDGVTSSNSTATTVYYDAAGRELQTTQHGVTPEGKDLVSHILYDSLGRKIQAWSPLPLGTQGGVYVPLEAFTCSTYSDAYHVDFSHEPMTGGRVVTETGRSTPGKSATYEYGYNSTEDDLAVTHYSVPDATTICNNGTYGYNTLSYTKQTDEDGFTVIVFKDNKDRAVLERRKGVYSDVFLDTYYVYDVLGRLICVLPPPAVEATMNEGTYTLSDSEELEQYAYFYVYDHRGRCISLKKPGTGWYYTVYDADSRPVLTATPEQHTRNEWNFVKYDGLGRVIQEGTVTNTTPHLRLVIHFDSICVRESADSRTPYGYTGNILMGTSVVLHKINYYDDYSFFTQNRFRNIFLPHPTGWANPHSLLTGTLTCSLATPSEYCVTAYWYDERARNIYTLEFDNVNNVNSRHTISYDFNDNIVRREEEYHTASDVVGLVYDYTYDHAGRLSTSTLTVSNRSETHTASGTYSLQSNSYDEMCRKSTESLYGSNAVLTHLYHTDGKYRGVESSRFTQYLHYDAEPTVFGSQYFDGRISSTETYQLDDTLGTRYYFYYDPFKRLSDAKAYNGSGTGYKDIQESFGYDNMSNMTSLYRHMPEGDVNVVTFMHEGNHRSRAIDALIQRYPLEYEYMYIPQGTASDTYAYDLNGNETRDLTRGLLNARYNRLDLPDSLTFTGGNTLRFDYLADGRRVRTKAVVRQPTLVSPLNRAVLPNAPVVLYDETRTGPLVFKNGNISRIEIDGGYISLRNDTTQQAEVKPYFFIKDYLGNVRLTCDGNSGEVLQSMEYLPSGVTYNHRNYSLQPYRFCGKEEVTLHGFDMYDSQARWQYSLIPRFSTMDPLAEDYYHLSPYAYCAGDPVNLVDPDGRLPILPIIWGIYEFGSAIYDIYNAFDVLSNEESTTGDKLFTAGSLAMSAILPGGGYTSLNKVDNIIEFADDAVDAAKVANKADGAVDAGKAIHSNSKKSEKAQHLYQIRNVENGEIVKVGISSGKISKKGKSYRATQQVNKWNKEIGADVFDSEIIEHIPAGKNARRTALEKEINRANELRSEGELKHHKYHKFP